MAYQRLLEYCTDGKSQKYALEVLGSLREAAQRSNDENEIEFMEYLQNFILDHPKLDIDIVTEIEILD